eukprot:gene14729-20773_t
MMGRSGAIPIPIFVSSEVSSSFHHVPYNSEFRFIFYNVVLFKLPCTHPYLADNSSLAASATMSTPIFVLAGEEREMEEIKPHIMACSKKIGGPLKVVCAEKPVDIVARIQQAGPNLRGVFLTSRLTAPGKEEFSDVIRKILKDKFNDVPIICYGKPSKGGDVGKHFHYPLDWSHKDGDPAELAGLVVKMAKGDLPTNWKEKKGKKDKKSVDQSAPSPRPSIDAKRPSIEASKRPSIDAGRRPSIDAGRRPSIDTGRRGNVDKAAAAPRPRAAVDGFAEGPERRNSVDSGVRRANSIQRARPMSSEYQQWKGGNTANNYNAYSAMEAMQGKAMGGMQSMGMQSMGMQQMCLPQQMGMQHMGGMQPMGMPQMGGLQPTGMPQMGGMQPMGMPQMSGMQSTGMTQMGGMQPMGMSQMGGMQPMGMSQMNGMQPVGMPHMGGGYAAQGYAADGHGGQPMGMQQMGMGMQPMGIPGSLGMPLNSTAMSAMQAMAQPMVQPAPTVAGVTAQVAGLNTATPAADPTTDLIKSLAEEVMRLRRALEEKQQAVATPAPVSATAPVTAAVPAPVFATAAPVPMVAVAPIPVTPTVDVAPDNSAPAPVYVAAFNSAPIT